MKTKSIVAFVAVTFVLIILLVTLARGSEVQAQEGKKKAPRAAPTITKKLNADFVDNLHASTSPKPNRLLALDANSKFPDTTIPDTIQRRVSGTCTEGSSIRVINANGTVTCDSVIPDSIQRRVSGTCAAGSSIRVINANGTVTCEGDDSGGWGLTGNAGTNPAANAVGTTDNQPLAFKTNNGERVRINANGNVGIGTTTPAHRLSILGGPSWTSNNWTGAVELATGAAVGWQANGSGQRFGLGHSSGGFGLFRTSSNPGTATSPAIYDMLINNAGNVGIGTTTPAHHLSVQGGPNWTSNNWAGAVELSNASAIGWQGNAGGQRFGIGQTNGGLLFFRTASNPGTTASPANYDMAITDSGQVAVGTITSAGTATLTVQDKGYPLSNSIFAVNYSNGTPAFQVWDDGRVGIFNHPGSSSTQHVCWSGNVYLVGCSSAAEYVPTVDGGSGFPETADIVSIAPHLKNPYGDEHGPFVAQKSNAPCDTNLLGFIVKPESGADGKKLNDHYLPLAIYGYFPAKVTVENGTIKRGDPLTSSSKPGHAMKATGACKIIGYALEDATKEGQIQVFANTGENTAPEVVKLRGKVDALTQENSALKQALTDQALAHNQALAAVNARLDALEQDSVVGQNAVAQAP